MMKKVVIIVTILVVLAVLVWFINSSNQSSDLGTIVKTEEICFFEYDSIYVKTVSRGLNYKVVFITDSESNNTPNPEREYVYTWTPIFYKCYGDTLLIYTDRITEVPNTFTGKIKVNQVKLNNAEMMNLYETYQKDGISLVE